MQRTVLTLATGISDDLVGRWIFCLLWRFETAWEPLSSFTAMERKHVFSASSQPAVTTAAAVFYQPRHLELGLAAIMVGLLRSCDRFEVCDVLGDCPLPWLVVTAREGSWVGNAMRSLASH